jgi:hypothetical protein
MMLDIVTVANTNCEVEPEGGSRVSSEALEGFYLFSALQHPKSWIINEMLEFSNLFETLRHP